MEIAHELKEVLGTSPNQRERLAAALSVSASTIDRWASGVVRPTARHLEAVQEVLADFGRPISGERLLQTLAQSLRGAREVMHRHGAASSRNEALDQISLLLTLHLQSRRKGFNGLQALSELKLETAFAQQVAVLRPYVPAGAFEKLSQSASSMLARSGYLQEIIEALRPALDEIDASNDWRRPHEFHEVFVNFLASSFHEEKEFAQYMTPREVVDFMVRVGLALCPEKTNPIVLDPSCGTGSFLTSFAEVFAEKVEIEGGDGNAWLSGPASEQLIGIDTSERMIRLATASFVACGIKPRRLFLDSSLVPSGDEVQKVLERDCADLILTNPPFGAEHSRGSHGGGRIPSEVLYLERYVDWLRSGGIALSIIPDSVLTNRGVFAQLRRELLDRVDLIAVVSLPPVTFAASGTTTKTSVIAFRKKHGQVAPETTFAVANHVGFQVSTRGSIRQRTPHPKNDLSDIADAIIFEEFEYEPSAKRAVDEQLDRWDAQFLTSSLALGNLHEGNDHKVTVIGVVAELVSERADPAAELGDAFQYIEIANVDGELLRVSGSLTPCAGAPSRARRRVRAGDILVSTVRPERQTVGVVPSHLDGAICSTGFAVLRPKAVPPYALAAALRAPNVTAQLVGIASGVAYPAFDARALPSIRVDLGSAEWQARCSAYGVALEALELQRRSIFFS